MRPKPDTEELLRQAGRGDQAAVGQLSPALGVSERAVTMRHLRALDRLQRILGD